MNDNQNHIGHNWSGRSPRSLGEAFPPRANRWDDGGVPFKQKVADVAVLVAFVAIMGAVAFINPDVFKYFN